MVYAVVEEKNVTAPRRLGSNLGDIYRFHLGRPSNLQA